MTDDVKTKPKAIAVTDDVKTEIRNRIRVALAAWAYEKHNTSLMTDDEFDKLCLSIRPDVVTGNAEMDKFFREEFDPSTGLWVHEHPGRLRLESLFRTMVPLDGTQ